MRRPLAAAPSVAVALLLIPLATFAAEPTPSGFGGDPRSPGEGPGLVGAPLFAIGVVVAIAIVAVVVTTIWVRATRPR